MYDVRTLYSYTSICSLELLILLVLDILLSVTTIGSNCLGLLYVQVCIVATWFGIEDVL